jgi:hypothetical protein
MCDLLVLPGDCNSVLSEDNLHPTTCPSFLHIACLSAVRFLRIDSSSSFLGHRTPIGWLDIIAFRLG